MTKHLKDYLVELVKRDMANAADNIARARIQRDRMPYDHDNNDALVRYENTHFKAVTALKVLEGM